jgi:hypothetical protein
MLGSVNTAVLESGKTDAVVLKVTSAKNTCRVVLKGCYSTTT